jgi:uncharacterized protein (TIGR02449 family)
MMNTIELNDLELEIDTLIGNLDRLKADNQTLRNQLAASAHERSQLQKKNQEAAMKIRGIIGQLREEVV